MAGRDYAGRASLPGQLTAINKENMVRPVPEASGPYQIRAPATQATPEAAVGRPGAGRPVCSELWRLEPSLLPWGPASCCLVHWDWREFSVFFPIPLRKAPSLCGSRRFEFTDDRKTH